MMEGDEKSETIIGTWETVAAGSELNARLGAGAGLLDMEKSWLYIIAYIVGALLWMQ